MELLEFKNVSYFSGEDMILKNISLCLNKGEFVSIVGPSGSGKSTFLKLCCHLISPTSGSIFYKGKDIMEYNPMELRKNIAYCFQSPYLFGDTVEENLAFPYLIRNLKVDMEKVNELFDLFKLDRQFIKRSVKNLSGGEKQRIALIRTLLFKPEVLLLDEVTSALDVDNTIIVDDIIKSLNKEGTTILWITHNPEQSKRYANKLFKIESGTAEIMEVER